MFANSLSSCSAPLTVTTDEPKQHIYLISKGVHVYLTPMNKSPPSPANSVTKSTETKKTSMVMMVATENTFLTTTAMAVPKKISPVYSLW